MLRPLILATMIGLLAHPATAIAASAAAPPPLPASSWLIIVGLALFAGYSQRHKFLSGKR